MASAAGFLVWELATTKPASYPSAFFLLALALLAAVWLCFIAVSMLRRAPWVRGATVVWQVLQLAVAVGCFQGLFARPDIGWLLLAPALAALALLFTRPVISATTRPES